MEQGRDDAAALFVSSSVQVQQKSSAVVQKKSYLPMSRGEYIVTKLDDLVNWARRVSPQRGARRCQMLRGAAGEQSRATAAASFGQK